MTCKDPNWEKRNGPDQLKRIIKQIKSSTRSRRGSIHCSSSSSPREWLLKSQGKIPSDLPSLYIPAFSPLSPSSHSSLPDNAVDHGHVDPNGQVSEPHYHRSHLYPTPAVFGPSARPSPLTSWPRYSLSLPQSLPWSSYHHLRPCGGTPSY